MSSTLKKASTELRDVLVDLSNTKDEISISGKVFHHKEGYVIHLVPEDFNHPLVDIINHVKRRFYLVSKLPCYENDCHHDDSEIEDGDSQEQFLSIPGLPIIKQRFVFVGTPISQQVYHLFQQNKFHGRETETVENYLDTSGLVKLKLKQAQYLASLYVQCLREIDLAEMWLLCDPSNPQGIHYLGVVPSDEKRPPQSPRHVSTVVVRSEDFDEKNNKLLLKEQKKHHLSYHKVNDCETHGFARYNIFGTPGVVGKRESVGDQSQSHSGITMEFAWDGVREILQPPPSSSNAVLKISADPGDIQSILPGVTNELSCILDLFSFAQKLEEEEDAGVKEQEEEFDSTELRRDVTEFLEKLKRQCMGLASESENLPTTSSSIAMEFDIAEALTRQDLDNTEALWVFLKDLPSKSQMIFCLEVVFQLLFLGEYQPVLYQTNETHIATLMKDVIGCRNDEERALVKAKISETFSRSAALLSIIDIGIGKLENDYVNYFIKQELVTKDQLRYFMAKDVSTVAQKIQRLLKLHCVLSLVTLAMLYGKINYEDLRPLVSAALKFYESYDHTETPVFLLSLPAFSSSSTNIKNICIRQFQPQTWLAVITTTNQYVSIAQLEARDELETFVDGGSATKKSSYSITMTSAHQICL